MGWGSAPIIAELFPGLWEYYAVTASDNDQFFSATGGAGYAYPWSLPKPLPYFQKVAALNEEYMPDKVWVDVWDGGCPQGSNKGENPCIPMYAMFSKAAPNIGGFSQWCSGCNRSNSPYYVYNGWLTDGTPVFAQPSSLWCKCCVLVVSLCTRLPSDYLDVQTQIKKDFATKRTKRDMDFAHLLPL